MTHYPLTMYGITEPKPGPRWTALFRAVWPAYRRWYLSEGAAARPGLPAARAALAAHMPELVPVWEALCDQVDADDEAAAMLTHWDLPTFAPAAACSQAAVVDPEPVLVRNYDYRPDLFECVTISTDHLQPVVGTSDCLWGLLDGMNGAGLVVSLTFGGDRAAGPGFAIPLVIRYLLETCRTVPEATAALQRIPVGMAYNVTMLDADGRRGTVHLGPQRASEFREQPLATNHRWRNPVDPAYAARYRSVERLDTLETVIEDRPTPDRLVSAMLDSPLYTTDYANGFGTLFTAEYRPAVGTVTYHWPGTRWTRGFDSPDETILVTLSDGAPAEQQEWLSMGSSSESEGPALGAPGTDPIEVADVRAPESDGDEAPNDVPVEVLAAAVRRSVEALVDRGSTEAFAVLVELSGEVGASVGAAARRVAETSSWSQVAEISGTTKQAAWSRWR